MRCDLHLHTIHSGMCTVPLARAFCRESHNEPGAVYYKLKRLGMDFGDRRITTLSMIAKTFAGIRISFSAKK